MVLGMYGWITGLLIRGWVGSRSCCHVAVRVYGDIGGCGEGCWCSGC